MSYILFDFHEILDEIRADLVEQNDPENQSMINYLDDIPSSWNVEDLPLYKDYLSEFELKGELEGKRLLHDIPDFLFSTEDCDILLKLVCASFSSTYELNYVEKEDALEFSISVTSGGASMTKKLQDLVIFQIKQFFRIYLNEQMRLDQLHHESEEDGESLAEERNLKIVKFKKMILGIIEKMNCAKGNWQNQYNMSLKDVDSGIDKLLNE